MHTLYGDGIHDDTLAIQERIDSGACEVTLPAPKAFYLISKPLELPSGFRLVLPRFAEVRLADQANCVMLRNKVVYDHARRLDEDVYRDPLTAHLWGYVDDFSPDHPCCDIEVCGGIWNCNNMNQIPNHTFSKDFSVREFYGYGMLFYNVRNLKLSNLTIKNPTRYGITMATVSYFTVEDITFDYNKGNPYPVNMDGVHLDGNCHYGVLRNLKGTCYDDLVALNAHEGSRGDITNMEINGIYAKECHSAVRLLLVWERVENIHISNVFGTYYQYCVGLSKFYPGETTGYYDGISLDHIYAAKAMPARKGDFQHPKHTESSYPLIWIQGDTVVKSLSVSRLHRRESTLPRDTIHIGKNAAVNRLIIDDVTTTNTTGLPMPLLVNHGKIGYLSMRHVDCDKDEKLVNTGEVGSCDLT
ncbi:MAG: hypothetical protein IJX39_04120 [Clostridia bacterium]|nr:hypothetical protein [Clostridia bacterium]